MNTQVHDERIARAIEQIQSILIPGESIDALAVQHRLFALLNRRTIVAATTGRLIAVHRGLIRGFTPRDVRWQDLKDAQLHVGIFGARLVVHLAPDTDDIGNTVDTGASTSAAIVFEGLDKLDAKEVYRVCQTQEQSWREKRRIRDLEEMRARAGGVHIGHPSSAAPDADPASTSEGPADRLERAKTMLDKGLISDVEYETIKAKIINAL